MANKFLDSNGVLYLWQKIKAAFASASDMTQAQSDIQALQNVGAQANVIESVKRNGTALTITNKAVDVSVPTKTSDLTNDSHYVADADYVHTDSNYTAAEKTKLAGIAAGANKTTVATSITAAGTNPVTSKAIYDALAGKQDALTFDTSPTSGSTNPVTSGGVYTALSAVPTKTSDLTNDSNYVSDANYVHTDSNYTAAEKTKLAGIADGANKTTVATSITAAGTNPVTSKAIYDALAGKQNELTFDSTPTSGSTNPVTSGGINTALGKKANLASPTFTGTPKAPTAAAATDNTQIATTAFVHDVADGKADAATTLAGYGITDAYTKSEVDAAIATGTALDIDDAPTSGSAHLVKSGGVYTALAAKAPLASPNFTGSPTAPTVSVFDNSTAIATTAYVNACVSSYVERITVFSIAVVEGSTLPEHPNDHTMYLLSNGGSSRNIYDEYIYMSDPGRWEKIGTTEVDLSNYMQKTDMVAITNSEIDTIVAS